MPSPSLPPSPELWAPRDLLALRRFVERNLDLGFRLALVEAESHAEREQILAPLLMLTGPRVLRVDCAQLEGHNLWHELLTLFQETQPRMVVLSGVVSGTPQDWMRQLNVQRDLFTRDLKVPWILFLHPAQRVPLMTIAPDFSDYVVLWVRRQSTAPEAGLPEPIALPMPMMLPSAPLPGDVHPLLREASEAIDAAQFDNAQDLLSRCDLRPNLPWDVRVLRRILGARLAHRQGQLQTAEHLLRVCRAELVEGPDSLVRTALLGLAEHDLSVVMTSQGRYTEAEALLRKKLDRARQTAGLADTSDGSDLHVLASVLSSLGKYAEAESLARQSLQITEAALGAHSARYTASVRTLAEILTLQARYAEAEVLLRRSLMSTERSLGETHPVHSSGQYMLGSVLLAQGKYQEAEVVLRTCVRATEQALGSEHPHFGAAVYALGAVLWEQGYHEEAESLLRRAVKIEEKTLGDSHPNRAVSLCSLAVVLRAQERYSEAEALLRRALAIEERALGTHHPSLCSTLSNLARVMVAQGRANDAVPLSERAVVIAEETLGEFHPDLGRTLAQQAEVQTKLGQPQAHQTAQRAVDVLSQSLGAEHPATRRAAALLESLNGPQDAPLKAAG